VKFDFVQINHFDYICSVFLFSSAYTVFDYTGCGKKTSPISNGSYKQIKKDTEKIL
jgi:hypothetical protein